MDDLIKFYTQVNTSIPFDLFTKFAEDYLKSNLSKFGHGPKLTREDWAATDNQLPFYALCDDLATKIIDKFKFNDFKIRLIGSSRGFSGDPIYGLTVVHAPHGAFRVLYDGLSNVIVTANHSQTSFDLNGPTSVDDITSHILNCCESLCVNQVNGG